MHPCFVLFCLDTETSIEGIDLVTVFDAILTSRQTREKLQCLYENPVSNNFRKTAVLEKNMNCKLKLHSKGFYWQIFGAVTVLQFLQKLALDFPYICLQFFPGNFYRQIYRKFLKKVLGLLAHVMPSNFFSRILKSEALVYNSYFFGNQPFYGNCSTLDSHMQTL